MVIGIGIMLVLLALAYKGRFKDNPNAIENFSLYWHFVDIVMISPIVFLQIHKDKSADV
jgi:heme/copper-type cytochrome/quinol oxidase subunit 3